MKTSNFAALLMATVISMAGFAAIDYLFTTQATWEQVHSAELIVHT